MEKPSYKGENPFKEAVKQVIEIEMNDMKNEIKKALYKQKPTAELIYISHGNAVYHAHVDLDDVTQLKFEVPVSDMGETSFYPEMDAKLLIRWLVVNVSDL